MQCSKGKEGHYTHQCYPPKAGHFNACSEPSPNKSIEKETATTFIDSTRNSRAPANYTLKLHMS